MSQSKNFLTTHSDNSEADFEITSYTTGKNDRTILDKQKYSNTKLMKFPLGLLQLSWSWFRGFMKEAF